MTYPEALAYLQSLQTFGFKPGLESTRRLAAAVGDPQDRLEFIHVAGTNGKGSVCAFLDSVYRAAGRTVGLFTSPHLVRFGERIQIHRQPISDSDLADGIAQLRDTVATLPGLQPTVFEFTTVLALRYFAARKVDLVIWETGLGGRFDATNIVTPLTSVITSVGLDHQSVLGSTVAAIAVEKAGIIKRGVPVVSGVEDTDARAIVEFRARELDAPLVSVGEGEVAAFRGPVGLAGAHQRRNAALAATTVRLLRALFPVSDDALTRGLAEVDWPGRLQTLKRDGQIFVLDGAHNRDGVAALREALPAVLEGRRPTLILGVLADKEWRGMVRALVPLASRVVTVPVSSSRAVTAEDLRAEVVATGLGRPVKAATSLTEALRLVAADPVVVITGSLYLVGEALDQLGAAPGAGVDSGAGTGLGDAERQLNDWTPRSRPPTAPPPPNS